MVLMRPTFLGGKCESYNVIQRSRHYPERLAGLEINGKLINSRYSLKVLPNGRSVGGATVLCLFHSPRLWCVDEMQGMPPLQAAFHVRKYL